MDSTRHEITISSHPYFSSGTIHRASCSCGKYISGKYTDKKNAEKAGNDHVSAKTPTGDD